MMNKVEYIIDRLEVHAAVTAIGIEALDFWRLVANIAYSPNYSGSKEKKNIHTYKYGEKQQNKTKYSELYVTLL